MTTHPGQPWSIATGYGAVLCGMVGYGLTVLALAPRLVLTLPGRTWIEPAMRQRAFPAWLGLIAALAAASCTAVVFSLIDPTGPLAPQGWLTYVLYLVPVLWLTAAPTRMLLDARRRPAETTIRFTVTP